MLGHAHKSDMIHFYYTFRSLVYFIFYILSIFLLSHSTFGGVVNTGIEV